MSNLYSPDWWSYLHLVVNAINIIYFAFSQSAFSQQVLLILSWYHSNLYIFLPPGPSPYVVTAVILFLGHQKTSWFISLSLDLQHQRRRWHPTPVLLPGKSQGWRSLVGLEKEMATRSSVLAWRIPGTGEPGGLPSMGHTESDMTEATQQQQQTCTIIPFTALPPPFTFQTELWSSS